MCRQLKAVMDFSMQVIHLCVHVTTRTLYMYFQYIICVLYMLQYMPGFVFPYWLWKPGVIMRPAFINICTASTNNWKYMYMYKKMIIPTSHQALPLVQIFQYIDCHVERAWCEANHRQFLWTSPIAQKH